MNNPELGNLSRARSADRADLAGWGRAVRATSDWTFVHLVRTVCADIADWLYEPSWAAKAPA